MRPCLFRPGFTAALLEQALPATLRSKTWRLGGVV